MRKGIQDPKVRREILGLRAPRAQLVHAVQQVELQVRRDQLVRPDHLEIQGQQVSLGLLEQEENVGTLVHLEQ